MDIPSHPAPNATPPPAPAMDAVTAIAKYRQLRDKIDQIEERHAQELLPYKNTLKALDEHIRGILNTTGLSTLKGASGTAFTTTTRSYKIVDPATFRTWCEANERGDLYENRVSKTVLEDMLARGEPLPPGIDVSSRVILNVRAPT